MKIVGISGNAGVGKDFITKELIVPMLTNGRPHAILSFADYFKFGAIVKDGLDRTKVFGRKDKYTRTRLQQIGTEEGRDKYGENIWVNIMREIILQYQSRGIEFIFITDCRFPNEVKFIEEMKGIVIRIEAKDRNAFIMSKEDSNSSHPSETSLQNHSFDYVIYNNIDRNDVADQVRVLILHIRERFKDEITVFCDLDDTLVECNKHYIFVRDRFIDYMKSLNYEITVDDFSKHNTSIMMEPYNRDSLYHCFVRIIAEKELKPDMEVVKNIANSVHNSSFSLLSPYVMDKIEEFKKRCNFVILTIGDPVDQHRKLFNAGLFNLRVECVCQKTRQTYEMLKVKYPSKKYVMIGDSIYRDILPAQQAGFYTEHITHSNLFWRLDVVKICSHD